MPNIAMADAAKPKQKSQKRENLLLALAMHEVAVELADMMSGFAKLTGAWLEEPSVLRSDLDGFFADVHVKSAVGRAQSEMDEGRPGRPETPDWSDLYMLLFSTLGSYSRRPILLGEAVASMAQRGSGRPRTNALLKLAKRQPLAAPKRRAEAEDLQTYLDVERIRLEHGLGISAAVRQMLESRARAANRRIGSATAQPRVEAARARYYRGRTLFKKSAEIT